MAWEIVEPIKGYYIKYKLEGMWEYYSDGGIFVTFRNKSDAQHRVSQLKKTYGLKDFRIYKEKDYE